jgi:hypothetical protein
VTETQRQLPRIIAILGRTDAGEYGAATCPHCGADGRYITTFVCEDGKTRGAMSGCIKLFPISPLANIHAKLLVKAQANERKGWKRFSSFDQPKMDAIEAVMAGTMTEDQAIWICKNQSAKAAQWLQNKKGSR